MISPVNDWFKTPQGRRVLLAISSIVGMLMLAASLMTFLAARDAYGSRGTVGAFEWSGSGKRARCHADFTPENGGDPKRIIVKVSRGECDGDPKPARVVLGDYYTARSKTWLGLLAGSAFFIGLPLLIVGLRRFNARLDAYNDTLDA